MGGIPILRNARLTVVLLVAAGLNLPAASSAQDNGGEAIRFAEKMPLAGETLVLDATPTSFGAVAVGARGHILISEDFDEWRQAERVPTRATLTAVDFVGRTGWAVGHDAVILRTTDAGVTWERQYIAPEREQPFLDVLFLDEERGFAVGAYGLFMSTTDGGETWVEDAVVESQDWHLNAITRSSGGAIYIAAEQGIIYRSTDNGSGWTSTNLSYQGSMFDIIAMPDGDVLTFGLRGRAFRMVGDGESWQAVDTGTESSLNGGRVLQGGRLVIVGNNGVILESESGGDRFTRRQHPSDEPLAGVLQGASGELIYYGLNGIGAAEDDGELP